MNILKFNHKIINQPCSNGFNKFFLKDIDNNKLKSFWFDIPLTNNNFDTVNCVIEIPQDRIAKYQVNKYENFHPITQDLNKRKENILRFYPQFLLFNYGYIPQTYESSIISNKYHDKFKGDEDPLDICEISGRVLKQFEIFEAKILSALCLIDQDEIDWKILVINKEDADKYNIKNIDDYNKVFPYKIKYIKNWFKYIKLHEGKKINEFLNEDKIYNEFESKDIIKYYNESFYKLKEDNIFKEKRDIYKIIQK